MNLGACCRRRRARWCCCCCCCRDSCRLVTVLLSTLDWLPAKHSVRVCVGRGCCRCAAAAPLRADKHDYMSSGGRSLTRPTSCARSGRAQTLQMAAAAARTHAQWLRFDANRPKWIVRELAAAAAALSHAKLTTEVSSHSAGCSDLLKGVHSCQANRSCSVSGAQLTPAREG